MLMWLMNLGFAGGGAVAPVVEQPTGGWEERGRRGYPRTVYLPNGSAVHPKSKADYRAIVARALGDEPGPVVRPAQIADEPEQDWSLLTSLLAEIERMRNDAATLRWHTVQMAIQRQRAIDDDVVAAILMMAV
jgi:hypothetical protein